MLPCLLPSIPYDDDVWNRNCTKLLYCLVLSKLLCLSNTFVSFHCILAVCKPGYYSTNGGIEPCVECPMGTYQENAQQTQCSACPTGTNTASTGSTSQEDCLCKYSPILTFVPLYTMPGVAKGRGNQTR